MPTLPMLYKGFKVKGLIDVFQSIAGNEGTVTGSTLQLQYHQPLYKYITLATQLQTGYSGGKGKILYNTGGWITISPCEPIATSIHNKPYHMLFKH
jgi:hypothetical protein